jgi:hypothetical protein
MQKPWWGSLWVYSDLVKKAAKEPAWSERDSSDGKRPFTRNDFFRDLKKAAKRKPVREGGKVEKNSG